MKKACTFFILLSFVACSGKNGKKLEIEKPTYLILSASRDEQPLWTSDISATKSKPDIAEYKYFVAEANHTNKRLCTKGSSARANAVIASEALQFIKESYGESIKSQQIDDTSSYNEVTLAQEVQSFLTGVETEDSFYLEKGYRKKLGALEDKNEFHCYTLVKIKRSTLEKILKESFKKAFPESGQTESKAAAQKAIEEATEKFAKIN
jgi:hypothetical protein